MFGLFAKNQSQADPAPRQDDWELRQEAERQRLRDRIAETPVDQLESLVRSFNSQELYVFEQITGDKYSYNPWKDEVDTTTWDELLEERHPGSCWKVVEIGYDPQNPVRGDVVSVHASKSEAVQAAEGWNDFAWGEYCQGYQYSQYVDVFKGDDHV